MKWLLLLIPSLCLAAVIPDTNRTTEWKPGVSYGGSGIPARADASCTCGHITTPAVGGDDSIQIQAAIDSAACVAGKVLCIDGGNFKIPDNSYVLINKAITVRGNGASGASATIFSRTVGAAADTEAMNCNIQGQPGCSPMFILGAARYEGSTGNSYNVVSPGGTKETTTLKVSVADATSLSNNGALNTIVLVDELSKATWQTDPAPLHTGDQICAASDGTYLTVVWQLHNPGNADVDDPLTCTDPASTWHSRQGRPQAQVNRITGINTTDGTITFASKFHAAYRTANTAQIYTFGTAPLNAGSDGGGAGLENLQAKNATDGELKINWCDSCWIKSVDVNTWNGGAGIDVSNSFRAEVRDSYVHDAAWPQPGGAGYAIGLTNGSADALIENNIVLLVNKDVVGRAAGAGSVVAYNYFDAPFINTNGNWQEMGANLSHMVGGRFGLFEGNLASNGDSDMTHGNATYMTHYRNRYTGIRKLYTNPHCSPTQSCGTPVTGTYNFDDINQQTNLLNGPFRAAGGQAYSYYFNFAGNVLGTASQSGWVYEAAPFGGSAAAGIYMFGWDGWSPYPTDSGVKNSAYRHGNYDYVNNSVQWDSGNTDHTLPGSFYTTGSGGNKPGFWPTQDCYTWPWVKPDTTGGPTISTLPAKRRFDAGTFFSQPATCS